MTARPATSVLVLGIDAANPELITAWARDGTLPNIAALMERGLTAASRSVEGFYVGSTWPSLYTGCSPARHGLHYLRQIVPGSYRMAPKRDTGWVQGRPFWADLGQLGYRVAILDVPLSRLDPGLNGVQVVEWGGHDAVFGFATHPPDLARAIRERYGLHPAGTRCDGSRERAEQYADFIAALERGARIKGELTADLIGQGGWDLVMQVFTESHCVGHQCWHLHDPNHPNHDPAVRAATGDPLHRVYRAIDQSLGPIVTAAGDAVVFLIIGHGMAYRFGASFLLGDILERSGATLPAPGGRREEAPGLAARVWRGLPSFMRRGLAPLRDLVRPSHQPEPAATLPPHFQASRCFPVGNGLAAGGIRLNLKGREPAGVVEPGPEAEKFLADLTGMLLEIVDARTDRPLVKRVLRPAEWYQGERISELPDLLVEWSDSVPTGSATVSGGAGALVRARSDRLGTFEGENSYGRTGEHRIGGMLVAAGGGRPAGRLDRTVSILDFAPTLCALFGLALTDCDGTVIPEFVTPVASSR